MAKTTIALGALTGIVSIAAGMAMQSSPSPVLNTVGHVAVWGGLINVGVAVGLAAVSTKWKKWRQEVHALADLGEMEMDIGQGLPTTHKNVLDHAALAERCTQLFEHTKPALAQEVVQRMDAVGSSLVHNMPASDKQAARAAVAYTMAGLRMGLGQPAALVGSIAPMDTTTAYKPETENDAQARSIYQWR